MAGIDALADRFRDEANPEHRRFGLVQKLHLPFGILFQAARNAAEQVAADLGHLGPGGLTALEFGSLIGRACEAAVADPKKIQRHDDPCVGPPPGPFGRLPNWNGIRYQDMNSRARTTTGSPWP